MIYRLFPEETDKHQSLRKEFAQFFPSVCRDSYLKRVLPRERPRSRDEGRERESEEKREKKTAQMISVEETKAFMSEVRKELSEDELNQFRSLLSSIQPFKKTAKKLQRTDSGGTVPSSHRIDILEQDLELFRPIVRDLMSLLPPDGHRALLWNRFYTFIPQPFRRMYREMADVSQRSLMKFLREHLTGDTLNAAEEAVRVVEKWRKEREFNREEVHPHLVYIVCLYDEVPLLQSRFEAWVPPTMIESYLQMLAVAREEAVSSATPSTTSSSSSSSFNPSRSRDRRLPQPGVKRKKGGGFDLVSGQYVNGLKKRPSLIPSPSLSSSSSKK